MDQDKLMDMQLQMRKNQVDLNDYLRELDTWEKDMKMKESKLLSQGNDVATATPTKLPPVRNSAEKKYKKKKKKLKPTTADENGKSQRRISSYDYRSWDKFDVEKACADVDSKEKSSSSEYETDEEWEAERLKLQAMMCKDEGNQLFKDGKYDEAIECYTRGIECDASNALLAANRAMALLKQEKYAAAELDCTRALTLDSKYAKALARRGAARAAQGKLSEARDDYVSLLALEPNNRQAANELQRLTQLLVPPSVQKENCDVEKGIVKPIYKPLHERSKKPLRRVIIEEIGDDPMEQTRLVAKERMLANQGDATRLSLQKDSAHFDELLSRTTRNASMTKKDSPQTPSKDSSLKVGTETGERLSSVSVCRIPPAPTTSYQFQVDWTSLANRPEMLYEYFKQIPCENFPKLFGQALDARILTKVFVILQNYYIPDHVDILPVLQSLKNVKRFNMTVMFLSSDEKENLRCIFAHLRQTGIHSEDQMAMLEKSYLL